MKTFETEAALALANLLDGQLVRTKGAVTATDGQSILWHIRATGDGVTLASGNVAVGVAVSGVGRNLLINGDFGIWQRGTNFPSIVAGYYPDRWRFTLSAAVVTVSKVNTAGVDNRGNTFKNDPAMRLDITTAGTRIDFQQRIEPIDDWYGTTVTLSILMRQRVGAGSTVDIIEMRHFDGAVEGSVIIATDVPLTVTDWVWQDFTFEVPLYTGATAPDWTDIQFKFRDGSAVDGDSFEWKAIKLEKGSVSTPFTTQGASIGEELALCQRYYWKGLRAGRGQGYTYATAGAIAEACNQAFPATMRIAPAMTLVGGGVPVNCTHFDMYGCADGFGQRVTVSSTGLFRILDCVYEADAEL